MTTKDTGAGQPAPTIYDTQWYKDTLIAVHNDKQSTFIVCDLLNEGREEFNVSIEYLIDLFNLEPKYEFYVVAMQYFPYDVRAKLDPDSLLGITAYRAVSVDGLPVHYRKELLKEYIEALNNGKMYVDQDGNEIPATTDELQRRAVAQRAILGNGNGNGNGKPKPLKRYETTLPDSLSYEQAVIEYKRFHPNEPVPKNWKRSSRFTWGLIFWEQESDESEDE